MEMQSQTSSAQEYVSREFFLEHRARNFSFQPGDFGYENLGEFEAVGLLTSPFPHSEGYSFYVVYANARHQKLMIRYSVKGQEEVREGERYLYDYHGAEAY